MKITLHPDVVDWMLHDGRAVALTSDRLVVLSPLAALILEVVSEGSDLDSVTRALVERFGVPTEDTPRSLTMSAVFSLEAQGVVALEQDH